MRSEYEGISLVVLLNSEMLEIIDEIRDDGGKATGVACNVLNEDEIENAVSFAVKEYGKLDIMINNAGIGYLMEKIEKLNQSDWDTVLNIKTQIRYKFFEQTLSALFFIYDCLSWLLFLPLQNESCHCSVKFPCWKF